MDCIVLSVPDRVPDPSKRFTSKTYNQHKRDRCLIRLSYQLGEAVAAGVADPLAGGGAVQPEWTADARLCPGGADGIFDGVENR